MAKNPITVTDLWNLARVAAPCPAQDGSFLVVPVTTYDMKKNEGITRLWHVADSKTRPLTSDSASSSSPAIDPSAARLAFIRDKQLHVMSLDGGEAECLTDVPYGVIDPKWFPDGARIAFLSFVHDGTLSLEQTAERKEELAEKPPQPIVTEDRRTRCWDQWLTDGRRLHLFMIDVNSRVITDLTPKLTGFVDPMEPAGHYDIAPDGREIVIGATRRKRPGQKARDGMHLVEIKANGKPGPLRDVTNRETHCSLTPRYSPDGRSILYGTRPNPDIWSERERLAEYDRRTKTHRLLTEHWPLTPTTWAYRKDGKAIITMADIEGHSGLFTMNRDGKRIREISRGGTFLGMQLAGGRIYTSESSLKGPGEAVSFALRDGLRQQHTSFTDPIMKQLSLGRVEDVSFTGARGDSVQMFLVHPPRKSKGKQKLVHLIHGGPHGSFGDGWQWRWCAQAFAAQGYLVAMVNFHGSDGWGAKYRASILGAWGDLPYQDIEAATDWLIAKRNVDPKRMAATGGSYGGYMASWIASQTDRYACIVNHAGVCDLQTQLSSDIPDGWPESAGGAPWKNREGMDRYSPMRHAEGFSSPMLIIHGEQDYRVPYYQALEIYNAYKYRNRDARLVFYTDENHWILKPQNSMHWYGEVFGWLKRWMGR